jgi:hypothetical protein
LLSAQRDAQELVRQSIRNGQKAWENSFTYHCQKREAERLYDSSGLLKSTGNDVYEIFPLGYGISFEEHVSHDGEPLPPQERARQQHALEQAKAESPADKQRKFEKELHERSYMKEVPEAFNFRIVGEEVLPTGPAWILEGTPRPGFQPQSRYAHVFPKMRGKLWIDQKDIQWVKADAEAMDTVSFGYFIARLSKGSHIILEQEKLPDGSWVPSRILAKASARIMLVFNHRFDEDITYSDYKKPGTLSAAK